jgi:hypothetical protein
MAIGRLCSGGRIVDLISAAHLAVIDRRDLSMWASRIRDESTAPP